jgi:hypothetical protein
MLSCYLVSRGHGECLYTIRAGYTALLKALGFLASGKGDWSWFGRRHKEGQITGLDIIVYLAGHLRD